MELVLLWIDELDDLVYAAAFILVRTRCLCLKLGLAAALALELAMSSPVFADYADYLAGTAAVCVLAWALALAADRLVREQNARLRIPA